jgi:hypothetical protein
MANLLQSSQTQASSAPSFYTDYLSNIATKGAAQIDPTTGAKFVGAQPLQETAFKNVEGAAGNYADTLTDAGTTLGSAVSADSPLSAATTYLTNASANPATSAAGYMSPYTTGVVNQIGNLGQRNIMQNLAPSATAGAVGSGQYGSKRGAEVLGQTVQNANRDILSNQSAALEKGYQSAIDAALKQNQINAQLGSTAGTLASQGQQNLINAGTQQGQLASVNQALNLGEINALSTLGEQQRTLKQNEELFPLSNLSTLSGMLRGYNVPMSTRTTAEMSPLSALAGVGTGALGLMTPGVGGKTPLDNIKSALGLGGAGTVLDIGGGLKINADGSISGGSANADSGMSNDDIYAQTLGYRDYNDFLGLGSNTSYVDPVEDSYFAGED